MVVVCHMLLFSCTVLSILCTNFLQPLHSVSFTQLLKFSSPSSCMLSHLSSLSRRSHHVCAFSLTPTVPFPFNLNSRPSQMPFLYFLWSFLRISVIISPVLQSLPCGFLSHHSFLPDLFFLICFVFPASSASCLSCLLHPAAQLLPVSSSDLEQCLV